ncbi:hypothetical protein [Pacificibacter sp. AS14]|uniref:hypothetical protein n=1 Tax=Pacificibacter sp. AS14 TaxID=3135785 RepID=UPI00316EEAE7
MIKSLDDRIADLNAKRRSNSVTSARDAEFAVGKLDKAVRMASLSVDELGARTDLIDRRASALEQRIRKLWMLVGAGVVATVFASIVVVALAYWSATRIKATAENKAARLRAAYAEEIAAVREEGEVKLAGLQASFAQQTDEVTAQMIDVRADLVAILQERETVRQELEHFIALRKRVGIQLVEFQDSTVVVVPEGARLRRWRAADLSEVAHLNGRMYRLSD